MIIQVSIKSLQALLNKHEELLKINKEVGDDVMKWHDEAKKIEKKKQALHDIIRAKDQEIRGLRKSYDVARLSEHDRWKEIQRLEKENQHLANEKSNMGKEGTDEIYNLMQENKGLAHENKINKQQYDLHLDIIARQTHHVQLLEREAKGIRKEIAELKHQRNQAWHDRGTLGRDASEEITRLGEENKRLAAGVCEKEEEIDRLKNQLKISEGWRRPVSWNPPRKNQTINRPPQHQDGVMHTHGDGHMRKDRFQREAADKTDSRTVLD